jgi:hypothetical protein
VALKFTKLYGKRGICVNLRQHCEVGSPGPKARAEINMFKEPVVQQMPDQFIESQSKSYIASETYLGVIAPVIWPKPLR